MKIVHDAALSLRENSLRQISKQNRSGCIALEENVFSVRMGASVLFPYERGSHGARRLWEKDTEPLKTKGLFDWLTALISEVWDLSDKVDMRKLRESDVPIGTFERKVITDGCYVFKR